MNPNQPPRGEESAEFEPSVDRDRESQIGLGDAVEMATAEKRIVAEKQPETELDKFERRGFFATITKAEARGDTKLSGVAEKMRRTYEEYGKASGNTIWFVYDNQENKEEREVREQMLPEGVYDADPEQFNVLSVAGLKELMADPEGKEWVGQIMETRDLRFVVPSEMLGGFGVTAGGDAKKVEKTVRGTMDALKGMDAKVEVHSLVGPEKEVGGGFIYDIDVQENGDEIEKKVPLRSAVMIID